MWIQGRLENTRMVESIFKETRIDNLPNLQKVTTIQVQKVQRSSGRFMPTKSSSYYSHALHGQRKRILKGAREKKPITRKRAPFTCLQPVKSYRPGGSRRSLTELKEKKLPVKNLLCPISLISFRYDGERRTFLNKQKQRHCIPTKSVL